MIGVTDGRMYDLYANWIQEYAAPVKAIRIGHRLNNAKELEKCGGLLLTGGEDVHPRLYDRPGYLEYCYAADFDEARDRFELKLLERAQERAMPVLGICRGLQLANVFFGGTLIPDIPSWGKFEHAQYPDGRGREHGITIDPASRLHALTGAQQGTVNSIHHQSADRIGRGLVASALSPDGVVEALERKEGGGSGGFLCLVQWHPERMEKNSPMVRPLKEEFMDQIKKYR